MGLGHTLRAALDRLPTSATVTVAELTPALVGWNRGAVAHLAGRPLEDPRTRVHLGDAVALIEGSRDAFDAILLDIDNGPASAVHETNLRLYGPAGVAACHRALADGGCLAVWSAHHDDRYLARLRAGGFRAEAVVAPARGEAGGTRHVVFLGVKEGDAIGRRPPTGPRPKPARPRR
jgi:spermidine synthase